MRQRFRTTQWLGHPVDFVFAFLANPSNLPKLMLPWQDARIDEIELHPARHSERAHPMAAIAAGTGTRMTLSFRPTPLAPVRVSWEARIEDFHWNERFCDRQLRGPFRYWRHSHRMQPCESEKTGEHGTLMIDTVEYELPFGRLGRLARRVAVERMLAGIFRYRQQRTEELLRELSAGVESRA